MKVSYYIEKSIVKIRVQPESDFEKALLKSIENKTPQGLIFRDDVYFMWPLPDVIEDAGV